MNSDSLLGDATLLLIDHRRRSQSDESAATLQLASGATQFLSRTGQLYPFLDFHQQTKAGRIQSVSFGDVIAFIERLWAQSSSAPERELLHVAMSALAYIEVTGQKKEFEDYLEYWRSGGLPSVVAAFKERQEAETWLKSLPVPPYKAIILVDNAYHIVHTSREHTEPLLSSLPYVAQFIERSMEAGLPPPIATFDTLEEAEAWLAATPEPPRHAFITIGGKYHLAAWWKNVNHRAIYPFTVVDDMHREMQEIEERLALGEKARLEGERPGGGEEPEEPWDEEPPEGDAD